MNIEVYKILNFAYGIFIFQRTLSGDIHGVASDDLIMGFCQTFR